MKYKLDLAEQKIENESHLYKPVSLDKKKSIETILKKGGKKKVVTLRLNNNDLEQIKNIAEDEGIPYQTLISSILHKYINKKYYDKDEVTKIVQMTK